MLKNISSIQSLKLLVTLPGKSFGDKVKIIHANCPVLDKAK